MRAAEECWLYGQYRPTLHQCRIRFSIEVRLSLICVEPPYWVDQHAERYCDTSHGPSYRR